MLSTQVFLYSNMLAHLETMNDSQTSLHSGDGKMGGSKAKGKRENKLGEKKLHKSTEYRKQQKKSTEEKKKSERGNKTELTTKSF